LPAPVATAPVPAAAPNPVAPANGAAPKGVQAPVKPAVAPATAAPPEGAPPVEQKYKVKVDGQVVEMTQAEMEKWASKGRYSDKATQEAKEAIKRAKAAEERLLSEDRARKEKAKANTDAWLREHGIDPDEYAKSKLEQKVEEGKMTPEQRQAAKDRAEKADLEKKLKDIETQRQEEAKQQLTNQLQRKIETELANAAKRAGMGLGDESFYAIYESFREAFELGLLPVDANGLQPHQADRIVEEAMGRLEGAQKSLRENALKLKGRALLEFVGKEAVDNIVAARLEEIREARGLAPKQGVGTPTPAAPAPRPNSYLSLAEADAQLKKLGGR